MGFALESTPDNPSADHEMLLAALSAEAVDPNRVLAYGAARHLLRDLRPGPDDVGGLAAWLMGGPTPSKKDDDEDDPEQVDAADLETEVADPDDEADEAPSDLDEVEPDEDEPTRRWPVVDLDALRVAVLVVGSILIGRGL